MVTTVRPKASETPTRPMPTFGNPAAMTALPQPPKVSQKVPIASAAYFFMLMRFSSTLCPAASLGHWRPIQLSAKLSENICPENDLRREHVRPATLRLTAPPRELRCAHDHGGHSGDHASPASRGIPRSPDAGRTPRAAGPAARPP